MATNTIPACPTPVIITVPPAVPRSTSNNERALQLAANQLTALYFTAAIIGLCVIIIGAHVISETRMVFSKDRVSKRLMVLRLIRSTLLQKVPFLKTVGFALVFVAYIGINVTLMFQNTTLNSPKYWTRRLAWLATYNFALVIFLALKNTPLAFLTAYSYERINILHQAAGYCTIVLAVAHGVSDMAVTMKAGLSYYLRQGDDIMGMVAGSAMIIILLTALFLRLYRYEVFYIVHIVMVILILITAGLHRPDLATRSTYIIIFAASIWVFDRIFRGSKILWNITGTATIHPLTDGAVRVVMNRSPWRANPGAHVFLWMPSVRAFETHPFTIVSTNPLELLVSPQDGFTRVLSALAVENPGATVRASCDGPYGTVPNFSKFDHVILIAGGAGATFTFGVAHKLLSGMVGSKVKSMVHFIWIIREHEIQSWFAKELKELSESPYVQISIYVTRPRPTSRPTTSGTDPVLQVAITEVPQSLENSVIEVTSPASEAPPSSSQKQEYEVRISSIEAANSRTSEKDIEKMEFGSSSGSLSTTEVMNIQMGRPDLKVIIRGILAGTGVDERSIVAACGPGGLMDSVGVVVGDLIISSGRSVDLHSEKFGW